MMKKRFGSRHIGALLLLLILALIPVIIRNTYIQTIFILIFYTASASLAWSVLGGLTGQLSLGHAAFMGLGAYTSTLLLVNANLSPWLSIPIAFVFVGLICMLLLSPCFVLHGPYFTLVTIAFSYAFLNLFTNWDYAGKGQGIVLPFGAEDFALMRFKSKTSYFYIALCMMVLFYIVLRLIDRSKLGYGLKTVREDEGTANAIGISPLKYKMIATFISAGMIAVCGVFYANYFRFIDPEIMAESQAIEYVLPAIIGGIGSVTGPLIGAFIIVPLSQYLNAALSSVVSGANLVVYAVILIAVVMFQPTGIMGWYQNSKLKKKLSGFFDNLDRKLGFDKSQNA